MFLFKKTLTSTRDKLAEISKEKNIILIVDELDRCLPSYAIKVLERLHHLFEGIDNIIVIISIDKKQLEHSIQQIYGKEIDIDKYLKKFISFSLVLDEGTINEDFQGKYSSYFGEFSPMNKLDNDFFKKLFSIIANGIDIRTQEKLLNRAKTIHDIVYDGKQLNPALLCSEIMFIFFSYKKYGRSLYWIPEINKATYSGLAEKIGKEVEEFLKESEKNIGVDENSLVSTIGNCRKIKNRLLDNTFWIFTSLYHTIDNNTCFEYYNENPTNLEKEVNIFKKFAELSKILE